MIKLTATKLVLYDLNYQHHKIKGLKILGQTIKAKYAYKYMKNFKVKYRDLCVISRNYVS